MLEIGRAGQTELIVCVCDCLFCGNCVSQAWYVNSVYHCGHLVCGLIGFTEQETVHWEPRL